GQPHLKPSSTDRYQGILREHIIPRWGTTKRSDVNHGDVHAWVSQLSKSRSAATTRKVHRVLSLILAMAVKDDRLVRNPASGVSLPRVVSAERQYLTHRQARELSQECAPHELVVLFLSYTGVRFGEMAALRVGRLDLMRRRASIVESVTLVAGVQTWGTPKGHERREVPVPRFLVDDLAMHVAGREPSDLVFTGPKGGALRAQGFQRAVLTNAAQRLAWTACILTRSGKPPRPWRSRRAPTSRSFSRCSATSQQR
ncbi:MAG: xerD, partial [Pseudonocardiales bacterium]|nr:xerD [Pseudonocardiales bacterium]